MLPGVSDPGVSRAPFARTVPMRARTGALSSGLRSVLQQGVVFPAGNVATLVVWAVVAIALAAWTFKWD